MPIIPLAAVQSTHPGSLGGILQVLKSVVLLDGFNVHVGDDWVTWRGMTWRNSQNNERSDLLFLDFCPIYSLSIKNITFNPVDQRSLVNFVIVWP